MPKWKDYMPMLIGKETEPFNDENFIFELKMDGIRALFYLDGSKIIIKNKRNKDITDIYPELQHITCCSQKKCVLDGEIVVFKNGKPDFKSVQARSLMTNPLKIKFATQQMPVQVVIFDILYYDNQDKTMLPLMERKKLLFQVIEENHRLSLSRYIETNGISFFQLTKDNDLEGIVGKRKDSLYFEGLRTKDWVKIKNMQDEDVIVCGIVLEDKTIKSYILASYFQKKLVYRGKVSLGISNEEKKKVIAFAQKNKSDKHFDLKGNIVWLKPFIVGTVHYMQKTKSNHFRQPVWKGLRNDKNANDCTL